MAHFENISTFSRCASAKFISMISRLVVSRLLGHGRGFCTGVGRNLADVDVYEVVEAAAMRCGSDAFDQETLDRLASKLETNWYRNGEDLRELNGEEAADVFGIPLRLFGALKDITGREDGRFAPGAVEVTQEGRTRLVTDLEASRRPHAIRSLTRFLVGPPQLYLEENLVTKTRRALEFERAPKRCVQAAHGVLARLACCSLTMAHDGMSVLSFVGRRHGLHPRFNLTNRGRKKDFILKEEDILPHLEKELAAFYRFLTIKFYDQQEPRVRPVPSLASCVSFLALELPWVSHSPRRYRVLPSPTFSARVRSWVGSITSKVSLSRSSAFAASSQTVLALGWNSPSNLSSIWPRTGAPRRITS